MRAALLTLVFALPVNAQDAPSLTFPVDCALGDTCMIQQLMDHDPGPGVQDFLCSPMSYDDHSGTDIRVPDMEALDRGVAVLAAAPGTVLGIRDSVPDTGIGGFPEGQDCGNGVLIEHANGWQTQYCHLAFGSVLVSSGDVVAAGQRLGIMGFSGNTEFPHLHMTLRQNGENVDPFDPSDTATCGPDADPLWAVDVPVSPGGILSIGFSDAIPEFEAIQQGTADADTVVATAEALVIWGYVHGGRVGDLMTLTITDPTGATFHTQEVTLDRTQAELFRATGRRLRTALIPGDYIGTVSFARDGTLIDTETTTISVN